jgi:hypothetical protein
MKWMLLVLVLYGVPSAAQVMFDTPEEFVNAAREASARYQDLESAIAAGYRKVGPDLPNMGEHWIQPRHAVKAALNPSHPSVLTYLRVGGKPILTGVAYTIGIPDGGEAPPPPVAGADWHFHSGAIEEEILGGMHHAHGGFRLGMIHAWVWTENPDGVFAADNWGLSFQRLGLPVPDHVRPAASKALFLPEGGVEYYRRLIDSVHPLPESARDHIREALTRHAERAAASADGRPDIEALSVIWLDLWSEIRTRVGEAAWSDLHVLAD